MIIDESYFRIEDQALLVVQNVMTSEVGRVYKQAKKDLAQDKVAQKKVQSFLIAKEKFEEISRFGHHAPGFKEIRREVRKLKREMDVDQSVSNFKFAEMDLQTVLDEVSLVIARQVSNTIKVPTGNPFFETKGSGKSGCGNGGSCNCG